MGNEILGMRGGLGQSALALALAAGCAAGASLRPTERPAPEAARPVSAAPPLATPAASGVTPQSSGSTPQAPSHDEPQEIARDGAPGNTRGTVACGQSRCDVKQQVCSWAPEGYRCVPLAGFVDPGVGGTFLCDDGSDCPPGKTCCQSFASSETVYHCVARNDDCAAEVCEPGGAACPKGQTCSGGFCSAPQKPVTCQDGHTCPSAQPVCLWRGASGRCVDEPTAEAALAQLGDDTEHLEGVHHCLLPRDCSAAEHCCTSMTRGAAATYCALNCNLSNSMQACATDGDCTQVGQALCGKVQDCLRHMHCVHPTLDDGWGQTYPSWFKTCQVTD